ncbi:uncharacterized protein LOC103572793 [Microplitis demolitor]|uniref:uncharacterized protein LOC103572793 n=1 Tax=Microplitis demolitor TaxID=69319 RepID=UPI0004CD87CD|nr:uncharacterized protein LOC103572793 [Microplitis demolitor]
MSKRFGKTNSSENAKRPRLDITVSSQTSREPSNSAYRVNNPGVSSSSSSSKPSVVDQDVDEWGEDPAEDFLENLDMIVSQASQDVNTSVISINPSQMKPFESTRSSYQPSVSRSQHETIPQPSTSRAYYQDTRRVQSSQILSASKNFRVQPSHTLGPSSNLSTIAETPSADDFHENLLANNRLNSTFQPKNVVVDPDEEVLRKLEKLENENKKLLDDLRIKEGESVYLRQQLNRAQSRNTQLMLDKERAIEEQANQYQTQVSDLNKTNARLVTELEFKDLEIKKTTDKFKKICSNQPPQSVLAKTPSSARKKTTQATQAFFASNKLYELKTRIVLYPFEEIPPTIFLSPLPEKPIVDIQIVDRSGKRNLPILQDEKTLRIFENPQIVKPMVTVINNKNLNVEFLHADIAKIIKITHEEINSRDVILIINKIVATTRELMINILTVLQSIKLAMNNDDIRDMNDIYLSKFYDIEVNNHQTLCDATEWHDKERGVEARRCLGLLVTISEKSIYLSGYIAGASQLSTQNDPEYSRYIKQMTRYREWSRQEHAYEMLELFNELATAIHSVRRSYQFTGLICGIVKLISNVQSTCGITDERALALVGNILKELVFSRPLLKSLIVMTDMMQSFNKNEFFINRLIRYHQGNEMQLFNDINSFDDDDCVLEIYLKQLRSFTLNNVNKVNVMYGLVVFADVALRVGCLKLAKEKNPSNRCCKALYEFIIHNLHRCATIDTDDLREEFVNNRTANYFSNNASNNSLKWCKGKIDGYYWIKFKNKFFNLLKIGIRFLTFFAHWDAEFFVNSPEDIDISIFLFMGNITRVKDLVLNKIDLEALELMKSKFSFEKDSTSKLEPETPQCKKLFSVKSILIEETGPVNDDSEGISFERRDKYKQMIDMFKSSLQL